MSSSGRSGQRQDVAFLALAVAFLAVALALFVGLKSIQRGKSDEPKPELAPEVEVVEAEVEKPPPSGARDPFRTQPGSMRGTPGDTTPTADVRLVGIVMEQGEKPMAILRSGRKRYYASVGERAAGYMVVSVSEKSVILSREGERVTLVLRQPVPEE
jgi:hypothetical protein